MRFEVLSAVLMLYLFLFKCDMYRLVYFEKERQSSPVTGPVWLRGLQEL